MTAIIAQRLARPPPCAGRNAAVIVLAAGASRRLGRPKQLVRFGRDTLVVRAVRVARALGPCWIGVVVGAGASRVATELDGLGAEVVRARGWRAGLAASLAAGVRRAPRRARYLVVMTVDQWRVGTRDLARLVAAGRRQPAAAAYADQVGVPAVFPRRLWPALTRLRGDRGARDLLARIPVTAVPMPAAASDLDTPLELSRLRASRRARP